MRAPLNGDVANDLKIGILNLAQLLTTTSPSVRMTNDRNWGRHRLTWSTLHTQLCRTYKKTAPRQTDHA